jgi:hypothetical protein
MFFMVNFEAIYLKNGKCDLNSTKSIWSFMVLLIKMVYVSTQNDRLKEMNFSNSVSD